MTIRTDNSAVIVGLDKRIADERNATIENARALTTALIEAADCIQAWGSYASAYFQEKHDLQGDIASARKAIDEHGAKYLDAQK